MPGRLLIASYSYPPIADVGSLRTIKLAKYLVRIGWAVHVVSVKNPDVWRMIGPAETPPGVEVTRTWDPVRLDRFGFAVRKVLVSGGNPDFQARAGLGRRGMVLPEFQAGWLLTAAGAVTRLARRWGASHLLGTGPPFASTIAAAIAQGRTNLPLVADFQDSWTIHPDTQYPTRIHAALDGQLERHVWRHASIVTVMTETVRKRYSMKYPEWSGKIRVVPNGFDPEDLPSLAIRPEGPIRIVYTGSFYPHSPPSTLLAALERLLPTGLVSPDHVQVDLVGRPEPAIAEEIGRRGLGAIVRSLGFRPLREAVRAACEADWLYLLIPAHFGEALADKVFTYVATGNPILAEVPEGETKSFLREWAPRVSYVPPGDVEAMTETLRDALRRGHSSAHGPPSLAYRAAFSREAQARRVGELLEGIA